MNDRLSQLRTSISAAIWEVDAASLGLPRRWLVGIARITIAVARDLAGGQLTLRAMGLVFTVLLSLAPLLAFTFSVLKGLGAHNQVEPLLRNFLAPLGGQGQEITTRILTFVENIRVGVLGSIGLVLLIYTVFSLLHKIEEAFNYIWRVPRARSYAQAFTQYVSVLLIGPLLMFTAMGITASLMSNVVVQGLVAIEPFGLIASSLGRLVPYLLVILAFTLTFLFMPNTNVRSGPALIGGVVGGVVWQATGWVFGKFVVTSTQYTAIYSSFAILILFMIWLFLSWLILLLGASVAFYCQHPEHLSVKERDLRLSGRVQERLALSMVAAIARRYMTAERCLSGEELAKQMRIPMSAVETLLQSLVGAGLLVEVGRGHGGYVPAMDLDRLRVIEVLRAVRCRDEPATLALRQLPADPEIEGIVGEIDAAVAATLTTRTFKELVRVSAGDGDVPSDPQKRSDLGRPDQGGVRSL